MFNIKEISILINKDGILCLLWASIQQVIVGASTLFIIESMRYVTNNQHEEAIKFILLFVASLILVYIPNTISFMYLQKWHLKSFENFIKLFTITGLSQKIKVFK